MDELFSADFQHAKVMLPPNGHGQKRKLKIRRVLIFSIIVVVLVSTCYLYSLHSHPHPDSEALLQLTAHAKQVSSDVDDEYSDFDQPPHLPNPTQDRHTTEKPQNHFFDFEFFAKEIGTNPPEERGKETVEGEEEEMKKENNKQGGNIPENDSGWIEKQVDKEDKETSDLEQGDHRQKDKDVNTNGIASTAHPSTDSVHSEARTTSAQTTDSKVIPDEWQQRFQQQGKLLQQQAKLLQQLQKQFESQQSSKDKKLIEQPNHEVIQHTGTEERSSEDDAQPDTKVSAHKPNQTSLQQQASRQSTKPPKQISKPQKTVQTKDTSRGSGLLDGVESFDGEIKGLFNGIVFRKNEPFHLAVNGIQPRRQYRPAQPDLVEHVASAEEISIPDAGEQDGSDRPNKPTVTQPLPKENSDEHSSGKHYSDKHTNGKHSSGKHSSGKHSSDKHTNGKHSSGKHPNGKHSSDKHSNGKHSSEKQANGKNTGDKHANGKHSSEKQSDGKYANGKHSNGKHSSDKQSDGKHSNDKHSNGKQTSNKHSNNKDRPIDDENTNDKDTKGTFGHTLETNIEKVLENLNDEPLEDEFHKVKEDFENVQPGFEPQVELQSDAQTTVQPGFEPEVELKSNTQTIVQPGFEPEVELHVQTDAQTTASTTTTQQSVDDGENDDNQHHHQEDSQPKLDDSVSLSVYDLSQPVQQNDYTCLMQRLSVYSRMICTDPSSPQDLVIKGSPQDRELTEFQEALKVNEGMGALDLGAGLGIFTVAAATLPRKVIAVESDTRNIGLFHKTMEINELGTSVILLTNALGQHRGKGWLLHQEGPPGRKERVEVEYAETDEDVTEHWAELVEVVSLDDLVPLVTFHQAVVRLNAPGAESKILKGGRRFFTDVDVQYVLLQWLPSQFPVQCIEAASLLQQFGLEPAPSVHGTAYSQTELWADRAFVVWRKTAQ